MFGSRLSGKDLITTQDWEKEELLQVLDLAEEMQQKRFSSEFTGILQHRCFLMITGGLSSMEKLSFEISAAELGGYALSLYPDAAQLDIAENISIIENAAKIISRYVCGLGIGISGDILSGYGAGDRFVREYARLADIPVLSMAQDRFNPCQGLADVMSYRHYLGKSLNKKKILYIWDYEAVPSSQCSVQESMLICSRMGMDVRIAHPEGHEFDPEVLKWTAKNCTDGGGEYNVFNDSLEPYRGVDIVCACNWAGGKAYSAGEPLKRKNMEESNDLRRWTCDEEKMKLTNKDCLYYTISDSMAHVVSDGLNSELTLKYADIAENRLHVQKAVMALTMYNKE